MGVVARRRVSFPNPYHPLNVYLKTKAIKTAWSHHPTPPHCNQSHAVKTKSTPYKHHKLPYAPAGAAAAAPSPDDDNHSAGTQSKIISTAPCKAPRTGQEPRRRPAAAAASSGTCAAPSVVGLGRLFVFICEVGLWVLKLRC
jgi:hypothetical protein